MSAPLQGHYLGPCGIQAGILAGAKERHDYSTLSKTDVSLGNIMTAALLEADV